jgi:hypothetical protein
VYGAAKARGELEPLLRTLSAQPDTDRANRVQVILDPLVNDEWPDYIRNWRQNSPVQEEWYDVPAKKPPTEIVAAA